MMEPERIDEVLRALPSEGQPPCEEALRSLADLSVSILRMIDARRERGVSFDDSYNEQMLRLALASMADQKFPPGPPMAQVDQHRSMLDKIARYLGLADQVFQIAESAASGETKYQLIFSEDLSQALGQIFRLDFYDPDTSYEEDVGAYVLALREKCSELRKIGAGR